jgi:hypothetical protein
VVSTALPSAPTTTLPSLSHVNSFRLASSGACLVIGSSSCHLPCSYSCIMATPVIGFDIE